MKNFKWTDCKKERILILSRNDEDYESSFKINISSNEWSKLHPLITKAGFGFHLITPSEEIEISIEQLKRDFRL
jgi:hypothetical protein